MNKTVVKTPKVPGLKLPVLGTKTRYVSLTNGLIRELSFYKKASIKETKTPDKKPTGAGRGGKYYSEKRSHYLRF